ncbi:MAG: DMT family transporter [Thermomicrobiales bacterium]|nr:DMT family transporter [Thermomicrobiales bacterium]
MSYLWLAATIGIGVLQALQVVFLGAMNRARGPAEATFVSIFGSLLGVSCILLAQTLTDRGPELPPVFTSPWTMGGIGLGGGVLLATTVAGLPPYFALTGLLSIPYLLAASWLGPRLGVALFMSAIIAGQLIGGLTLDHLGAFGATPRPVDAVRLLGVAALIIGVALIRGRR